jgi:two-component system, chemotaxis family, CheB/CheR fusion protein
MTDIDPQFEDLLEFVRNARAFDYSGYRRPSLMRRFEKRMQTVGADTYAAYQAYLEDHPEEFNQLFNTILINVTGFFRDKESWELLASEVLPQLISRKQELEPIRVWSAGCASGEEPYTVAMILAEELGEEGFRDRVKIYATDIDEEALGEAREAAYTDKQLANVPDELRSRYFMPSNGEFTVRNDLRRGVIFGRNDLHQDPPISRVDLLISRNTLMYFSPPVQERILGNFHFALTRHGYLMVGKAEALQSRKHMFVAFDLKRRIFVKDGDVEVRPRPPRPAAPVPDAPSLELALSDTAFEHAPVAQIVIDQTNHVVGANQAARALFSLRLKDVGRPLQDLELSYRPVELRSMIDQVRSERRPVTTREVSWPAQNGDPRSFDVQVSPLVGADRTTLVGIGVTFLDVTPHRMLQDELEVARRELETAYEELQSTVEELETTNEELQSTNEELETTNEELHSTNEELETMNEELQSTNEELETMNDEMRERTDEAIRANAFLRSVLSSVVQSLVVLDRELRVTAWSAMSAELWGLREDEVEGQHFLNLDIGLPVADLRPAIRSILAGEDAEPVALDGHDRRGRPIRTTVSFSPLRGPAGELLGVIIVMDAERRDE